MLYHFWLKIRKRSVFPKLIPALPLAASFLRKVGLLVCLPGWGWHRQEYWGCGHSSIGYWSIPMGSFDLFKDFTNKDYYLGRDIWRSHIWRKHYFRLGTLRRRIIWKFHHKNREADTREKIALRLCASKLSLGMELSSCLFSICL